MGTPALVSSPSPPSLLANMNQFSGYDSNQLVDYTGYNYVHNYLNPDPVMPSDLVCEPFSSDTQQFYSYFDEDTPHECTNLQVAHHPIIHCPLSII